MDADIPENFEGRKEQPGGYVYVAVRCTAAPYRPGGPKSHFPGLHLKIPLIDIVHQVLELRLKPFSQRPGQESAGFPVCLPSGKMRRHGYFQGGPAPRRRGGFPAGSGDTDHKRFRVNFKQVSVFIPVNPHRLETLRIFPYCLPRPSLEPDNYPGSLADVHRRGDSDIDSPTAYGCPGVISWFEVDLNGEADSLNRDPVSLHTAQEFLDSCGPLVYTNPC